MNEPRPARLALLVDRAACGATWPSRVRRPRSADLARTVVWAACAACIVGASVARADTAATSPRQPAAEDASAGRAGALAASPVAADAPLAGTLDALQPMVRQLIERQAPPHATAGDGEPVGAADAGTNRGRLRVEVEVGRLDERLRLAPCNRIEPQWPAGQRAWGRIRVGLRCVDGPVRWKVYLPVTVKVHGRALVARDDLPAGTRLEARHVATREVDLAQGGALPLPPDTVVEGRELARSRAAGEPLHANDLRARRWFAAGDVVQVVAFGAGYQVGGEGTALDAGLEGRRTRVRTESGRVVVGQPVAERRIEVRP